MPAFPPLYPPFYPRAAPSPPLDLIQRLLASEQAPEMWTRSGGVNEFDLLYAEGAYHLFLTHYEADTRYRCAETLGGLETAAETQINSGKYPSALFEDGQWHLWVTDASAHATRHFIAASPTGTWSLADTLASGYFDVHVRKGPDGRYFASYKKDLKAGVLVADAPGGPWTDLGFVFADLEAAGWHAQEEADAAILFDGARAYVAFAGWNGSQQRVGIVEVDATTMRAIEPATVLVEPAEPWQQRNGSHKVFSPVYLRTGAVERLFFSHNPSAGGVTTGWSHLRAGDPLHGQPATPSLLWVEAGAFQAIAARSPFSDPHAHAYGGSRWVVRRCADLVVVHDSGWHVGGASYTARDLPSGSDLEMAVQVRNAYGEESELSAWISFSTSVPDAHARVRSGLLWRDNFQRSEVGPEYSLGSDAFFQVNQHWGSGIRLGTDATRYSVFPNRTRLLVTLPPAYVSEVDLIGLLDGLAGADGDMPPGFFGIGHRQASPVHYVTHYPVNHFATIQRWHGFTEDDRTHYEFSGSGHVISFSGVAMKISNRSGFLRVWMPASDIGLVDLPYGPVREWELEQAPGSPGQWTMHRSGQYYCAVPSLRIYSGGGIRIWNAPDGSTAQLLNAGGEVLAEGVAADGMAVIDADHVRFPYEGQASARVLDSEGAAIWWVAPAHGVWDGDWYDMEADYVPPPVPPALPPEEFVVFEEDDERPYLACSALYPSSERKYLLLEEQLAESSIDLAEGRSVIGQLNVRILDRRTDPADQASGWLTGLLTDAGGESALIGRRALRRRWMEEEGEFRVLLDGVISGVFLERYPDWVTYTLPLRDVRERERRTAAFTGGGTTSLLPAGVLPGFGHDAVAGTWLVPPTAPLVGTAVRSNATAESLLTTVSVDLNGNPEAQRLVALAAFAAMHSSSTEYTGATEISGDPENPEHEYATPYRERFRRLRVLWRPAGSAAPWTRVDRELVHDGILIHPDPEPPVHIHLPLVTAAEPWPGPDAPTHRVATVLHFGDSRGGAHVPADGQEIELIVAYAGPPSKDFPVHLEGMTLGELLMRLYDGEYSDLPHPVRVPYDEDAMLRMDTPVLGRLTEPVKDMRRWTEEQGYKPCGFAPALDHVGRISPVRLEAITPGRVASLPLIDASVVVPEDSDWGHDSAGAINTVRLSFPRFAADGSAPDGVRVAAVVSREHIAGDSAALLGEQAWEAGSESEPLHLFGAIGTAEGEARGPETGDALFRDRRDTLIPMRRRGAQRWVLPCRESRTRQLRVGDEVRVQVPWMPDYATGRRGLDACGIVVAILDRDLATRVITVEHVPVVPE
jgi:hypothetical protein